MIGFERKRKLRSRRFIKNIFLPWRIREEKGPTVLLKTGGPKALFSDRGQRPKERIAGCRKGGRDEIRIGNLLPSKICRKSKPERMNQ
jgi:hypothetical protein